MGTSATKGNRLEPIGESLEDTFWNVRASFKVFGFINIGTHMSIIKLKSGKFLIIDTIPMDDEAKLELDNLTDGGKKIEAVVATHPFHTLSFPAFHKLYPDAPYYGTPRHLRNQKDIPWAGSIAEPENLNRWSPEVEMRIPSGAEFDAPEPESFNHFSAVWVFHPFSKTIHVDDCVNFIAPCGGFKEFVTNLFGKTGTFDFHPSVDGPALYPTSEAPHQFVEWFRALLHDWDFDNVCTAHIGVKTGNSKALLEELLENSIPLFDKLSKNANTRICPKEGKIKDVNVEGNECG